MKHLLQRQRQLRSLSPSSGGRSRGRSRSLSPWRYGERFSSPKSVASLRRRVGLLEVPSTKSSRAAHAAHAAHAAPWEALGRRRPKDQATAFLFNIGKGADEANQIDQETDQLEIQEEAKTIVNAEGAGYDPPTGVEEGEEDEFEHEMEEAAGAGVGVSPGAAPDFSQRPGCQCDEWDPLTTALPEDKQHASLVMLQRRIRPENHVAPSLREAAASVERAGRLFEGWVHRRQQLADVLPDLAVKMESCHNRAKNFAKSAAEKALHGLEERLEEEEEAEADAEEQAEMAEGQNRFEAVAEAQEDFNEMVQEGHLPGAPGPNGAAGALHQPGTAFEAQGVEQLAQSMGQIYGHGGHGPPPIQGEVPPGQPEQTPEEAVMEAPQQLEVEEEIQEDADLEQAKEVENWGDFFRECGEFRIPPTVLAARRAANEAYWAFDRAMHVAEKKVGRAIQHSLIRGA